MHEPRRTPPTGDVLDGRRDHPAADPQEFSGPIHGTDEITLEVRQRRQDQIAQAMSGDLVLTAKRKSKREASARSVPASARSELRMSPGAEPRYARASAPSCRVVRRS